MRDSKATSVREDTEGAQSDAGTGGALGGAGADGRRMATRRSNGVGRGRPYRRRRVRLSRAGTACRHSPPRAGESAQPRLPARHGRPDRAAGSRPARQLLDVAHAHVPVSRSARPRRARVDRRLRPDADAGGRLRRGGGVPLRPSSAGRRAVRPSLRALRPHRRRGIRDRDRTHPAAGPLPARRLRRQAARRRTASLRKFAGAFRPAPGGGGRGGARARRGCTYRGRD